MLESDYNQTLEAIELLMDAAENDKSGSLYRLVDLLADRIRAYEDKAHPWPDTTTPASILRFLMDQHKLSQSQLPEIGSQGVVSEILSGKRDLNVRQITALSSRFGVDPGTFI